MLGPAYGAVDHDRESSAAIDAIKVDIHIAEYFLTSKPGVAMLYADSVEAQSEREDYKEGIYRAREIKARALKKKANYEGAINYFDKAIAIANEIDQSGLKASCYYEIGDIYMILKKYPSAIDNFDRALRFEDEIDSPELLASLYTGLWMVYWIQNDFSKALSFQEKAVKLYRNNQQNKEVLSILNQIGKTFRRTEELDQALEYYQNSLHINESQGGGADIAKTLYNIGEIYFLQNNYHNASKYFGKAIDLLLTKPGSSQETLIMVYFSLARTLAEQKKYTAALDTAHVAHNLSRSIRNISRLSEGSLIISNIYEKMGEPEKSLSFYKSHIRWKDSLLNAELADKIANITSNYEFNQKEREIQILATEKELLEKEASINMLENKAKGYLIILLVALILSSSALSYIVWKRYEVKKKANETIKKQYDEISFQKNQVEKQRDIIVRNNVELEKAKEIIQVQNGKLQEANERLEEKVNERTNELKRAYQKLSFHVDNTPLGVMEWNDQLELTRWSRQAEAIFGIPGEEILGKSIKELPIIHEEDKPRVNQLLEELLIKRKPRNFYKIRGVQKDGTMIYLEWSNSILFADDGKLESILSVANNVTDREKAYYELQDLNQELDNFIYRASHDLQGPLSRMEGLIHLGKRESTDKVSSGYFDMLASVNKELNQILGRLRFVYNFYQRDLAIEEVEISATIDEVIRKVKSCRKVNGLKMQNDVAPGLTWKIDKLLFEILVESMIENAICYKEHVKGYVKFTVPKSNGSYFNLLVKDNGVGIPVDVADRIFDIFFRGTLNPEEAGMNLYIAKKAVNRLGGAISLVNPSKETIFEISLPTG